MFKVGDLLVCNKPGYYTHTNEHVVVEVVRVLPEYRRDICVKIYKALNNDAYSINTYEYDVCSENFDLYEESEESEKLDILQIVGRMKDGNNS